MEANIGDKIHHFHGVGSTSLNLMGKRSLEWDMNDWKWDGHLFIASPLNCKPSEYKSHQFLPEAGGSSYSSSTCSENVNIGSEVRELELLKVGRAATVAVTKPVTYHSSATTSLGDHLPQRQLKAVLDDLVEFVKSLREMPIAIKTDEPKVQHYELPTSFFKLVLGKHLKYSCCYFEDKASTLDDAEKAMLEIYCEKAQLRDGHSVLDVGCGWGSLSLYIAQKYSNCKVTGICNSVTQKAHIEDQCRNLQLENVEIVVADISTFDMEASYDRIFSIEMFEHMKNYKELLKKISNWMKEDSLLFVHYFCHKAFAYHFEDLSDDDWITRYFFTGGTMPSANLLLYFQDDVSIVDHWLVNGRHYSQTSEEWLKKMDQNIASIKPIMVSTYGKDESVKWTVYWRTFFISVAELFGYNNGEEWMVAHFLFKKK